MSSILSSSPKNIIQIIVGHFLLLTLLSLSFSAQSRERKASKPRINISSPSKGSVFAQSESLVFVATAKDRKDGNLSDYINWTSSIDGEFGMGSSVSYSLSAGYHTITASVTNSDNYTSSKKIAITITASENNSPELSILSPANNASFGGSTAVSLSASATDIEEGNLSNNVQWYSNLDGELGIGASISVTLTEGSHAITASITDVDNAQTSQRINLAISAPQNSLPTVSILSPSNNASFDNSTAIQFTASANDDEDGNLSETVNWYSDLDGDLGKGASIVATLSSGTHLIIASVTDSANDLQETIISLTIEEAPVENPGTTGTATLTWSTPSTNTDGSQLTDLAGFTIYYGTSADNLNLTLRVLDANQTSVTIDNLQSANTYYFAITALNTTGVESYFSTTVSKLIQ